MIPGRLPYEADNWRAASGTARLRAQARSCSDRTFRPNPDYRTTHTPNRARPNKHSTLGQAAMLPCNALMPVADRFDLVRACRKRQSRIEPKGYQERNPGQSGAALVPKA